MEQGQLQQRRALMLKAMGPAVCAVGLAWAIVRLTLTDPSLTLRAIAFAPPHQMMFVGLLIALICVPLAAEVQRAGPDDLALPGLEAEETQPAELGGERRGRSYQGYN
jgi:hypothetical protein